MNTYIALDTSIRMSMFGSKSSESKLKAVTDFLYSFVDVVDHAEVNLCLISFNNNPEIICDKFISSKELQNMRLISKKISDQNGIPNFSALSDLILCRQSALLNFELIIVVEATSYFQIPVDFNLPCTVQFVGVTSNDFCAQNLLAEFEAFSRDCALEANFKVKSENGSGFDEIAVNNNLSDKCSANTDEFKPLQISTVRPTTIQETVNALAKKKRTKNLAVLNISANFLIEVYLTPGLLCRPFAVFNEELLTKEIIVDNGQQLAASKGQNLLQNMPTMPVTLNLLGFIKTANFLLHLPSTPLIHGVKPKPLSSSSNYNAFHLFAETLGSEGQLAVFQHFNGEECIVRALRSDAADPWLLCMQFYSSNCFRWMSEADASIVDQTSSTTKLSETQGISYKANSLRSYWTDAHGLQSDVLKISRLLKRVDRLEQFYQEIRRVSLYAVACGYDSFAQVMANFLEKRCVNIPQENKEHLVKVVETLRKGGFKLISQSRA